MFRSSKMSMKKMQINVVPRRDRPRLYPPVRPPQTKADANQWQPKYVKQNPWHMSQTTPQQGINATNVPLPLYIRPQATFGQHQGRISIVCGTKPAFEKPVESVSLEVRLPARVLSADPTATHGMATYDDMGHHVKWVIDKFPSDKTPCLTVQLQLESNAPKKGSAEAEATAAAGGKTMVSLQELVDIHAQFSVAGVGVSGIKVETLQVRNEKYKPSQGVRYHTRGGRIVVRT